MPSLKGLVLWHTFEKDKIENSKVKDRSAWENHGTLKGPTSVDGKIGKGFSFDGVDDYIDCGNSSSLQLEPPFTLETWFLIKGDPTAANHMVIHQRGGVYGVLLFPNKNLDRLYFATGDGSVMNWDSQSYSFSTDLWYHVAVTYADGTKTWYINGINIGTKARPVFAKSTANLGIGGDLGIGYYVLNGLIDEVRIYDRALSAGEVERHFQEELPAHTREKAENLAGLWIPEISVNTSILKDLSRWENHGSIIGATWKWADPGVWVLEFDGVDDYVDCGRASSLRLTDQVSIEAWMKSIGDSGPYAGIADTADYGLKTAEYLYLYIVTNVGGNLVEDRVGTTSIIEDDKQWHHVVGTFDGTTMKIYVDGSLADSKTHSQPGSIHVRPSFTLKIGRRSEVGSYFSGIIGKVRIYGRALLATETKDHFESQRSRYGV